MSLLVQSIIVVSSVEKAPTFELKPLPSHLYYANLEDSIMLTVIIVNDMTKEEEKIIRGTKEAQNCN